MTLVFNASNYFKRVFTVHLLVFKIQHLHNRLHLSIISYTNCTWFILKTYTPVNGQLRATHKVRVYKNIHVHWHERKYDKLDNNTISFNQNCDYIQFLWYTVLF